MKAPSETVIDQRKLAKLAFDPHITVVQVGTAVDFQNDDSTQHHVVWPSISGNKKLGHNLGTWPKRGEALFQVRSTQCCATAL
jgi:plastocyanin